MRWRIEKLPETFDQASASVLGVHEDESLYTNIWACGINAGYEYSMFNIQAVNACDAPADLPSS